MPLQTSEQFITQIDSSLLSALKGIAQKEGQQLQTLVNEALLDLVEKHKQGIPRAHVMATYQESLEKFDALYKKLAQ